MIVNDRGQPFDDVEHTGASKTLRDTRYWRPRQRSADASLRRELRPLTDRARDLEANSGVAKGAAQLFADHVIGPQLRVNMRPNWRALGRSQDWAFEFAANVEARLQAHFNSRFAFDFERQQTLTEMASTVLRGDFSAGGHLVLPFFEPSRPGVRYGTCFMSVEIDRLSNPQGKPDSATLRDGVQTDRRGVIEGYHVLEQHPGDWLHFGGSSRKTTFVPAAFPWGRPRLLHCFTKTRAGQTKAGPALAAVLREFKALRRYRQAELNSAVTHALTTYFIKTDISSEQVAELFTSSEKYLEERADHNDGANGLREQLANAEEEDNRAVVLFPNESVESPKTPRDNDQMEVFSGGVYQEIANCLGISRETLLRDFTKSTYASAKAALAMDWRRFMTVRTSLIGNSYAIPITAMCVEEMVAVGDIDAPDFYEQIDAYTACSVVGTGRGWLDPSREANAARTRIAGGFSNQLIENAEQGADWQDVMLQRAYEIKAAFDTAERLGLPEVAAYELAGLTPPKSEIFSTPISSASRIGEGADPGAVDHGPLPDEPLGREVSA